ncbi:uncharacterized protein VTP21DRAFT_9751 [Calcarisporiella thermophila]|uniref:uncharacterized protein n=1 Tax=Calcarisporiella thermophila TaxID=911321 RepID=UPI0037426FBC
MQIVQHRRLDCQEESRPSIDAQTGQADSHGRALVQLKLKLELESSAVAAKSWMLKVKHSDRTRGMGVQQAICTQYKLFRSEYLWCPCGFICQVGPSPRLARSRLTLGRSLTMQSRKAVERLRRGGVHRVRARLFSRRLAANPFSAGDN